VDDIAEHTRPSHETVRKPVVPAGTGIDFQDLPTFALTRAIPAEVALVPTDTQSVAVPHATAAMYPLIAGKLPFDHDCPEFVETRSRDVIVEPAFGDPRATHDVDDAHAASASVYCDSTWTAHEAPPFRDTMIALATAGPSGPLYAVAAHSVGAPHDTVVASPTELGTAASFQEAPRFADRNALAGRRPPQPPTEHSEESARQEVPVHDNDFRGKSFTAGTARITHFGGAAPASTTPGSTKLSATSSTTLPRARRHTEAVAVPPGPRIPRMSDPHSRARAIWDPPRVLRSSHQVLGRLAIVAQVDAGGSQRTPLLSRFCSPPSLRLLLATRCKCGFDSDDKEELRRVRLSAATSERRGDARRSHLREFDSPLREIDGG
jgi:hypothetical protein